MIEAEAVRAAALAVPLVLATHPGPHGTAATFTASGRVWGVRLAPERIDVHLVAALGAQLAQLGRDVQSAVRAVVGDYAGDIVVHFEDLDPQPTVVATAPVVSRTPTPRRLP